MRISYQWALMILFVTALLSAVGAVTKPAKKQANEPSQSPANRAAIYSAMQQAMPRAREAIEGAGGGIDWEMDGNAVTVTVKAPVVMERTQAREVGLLAAGPFSVLPVGTVLIVEVRSPAGQLLDRQWNMVASKQ